MTNARAWTRAWKSEGLIRCTECEREADEFVAAAEDWRFWSDDRDVIPYCPECSMREFAPDAPASGPLPLARGHDASSSGSRLDPPTVAGAVAAERFFAMTPSSSRRAG